MSAEINLVNLTGREQGILILDESIIVWKEHEIDTVSGYMPIKLDHYPIGSWCEFVGKIVAERNIKDENIDLIDCTDCEAIVYTIDMYGTKTVYCLTLEQEVLDEVN